jgi:hypothetical protein
MIVSWEKFSHVLVYDGGIIRDDCVKYPTSVNNDDDTTFKLTV